MKDLLEMFYIFARVGALTFGGGYAMMPILQREVVDKKHWATQEEVIDYYAVGQCMPGLNSVNTAIFIGYQNKKTPGALAAALGLVTPSIIIIIIIAMFLGNIMGVAAVENAFAAIRVAVCALVLQAAITMIKSGVVDKATAVIFVASAGVMLFTSLSPIPVILASGVAGVVIKLYAKGARSK